MRHVTLTSPPFPTVARAVAATLGELGIEAQAKTMAGATLRPRYRSRRHQLILALWSPDYVDPHSNAHAFARNPDNRPEANLTGVLAWRNAWASDELNAAVIRAHNELDPAWRAELYRDCSGTSRSRGRT